MKEETLKTINQLRAVAHYIEQKGIKVFYNEGDMTFRTESPNSADFKDHVSFETMFDRLLSEAKDTTYVRVGPESYIPKNGTIVLTEPSGKGLGVVLSVETVSEDPINSVRNYSIYSLTDNQSLVPMASFRDFSDLMTYVSVKFSETRVKSL